MIACEDIGPADDVLASFVVACANVFPPKRTGKENVRIFSFLAEQMCSLPNRSRIYCSYAITEILAKDSQRLELTPGEREILAAIMERKTQVKDGMAEWERWLVKNNWRASGLLKFVGLRLSQEMKQRDEPLPHYKMLFSLPSYSYDLYTRVGLEVLRKLVRGVHGAEGIREMIRKKSVKTPTQAVGEALFFSEGGKIRGELIYEPLSRMEQRFFAFQFGLSLEDWLDLRALVKEALEIGLIDRLREETLCRYYGQKSLEFDGGDVPGIQQTNHSVALLPSQTQKQNT